MDQTALFKATVKACRTQKGLPQQTDILKKTSTVNDEFENGARDIARGISKLYAFLLDGRRDYIEAPGGVSGSRAEMTESERDEIDMEAATFVRSFQENIGLLRKVFVDGAKKPTSTQLASHRLHVTGTLEAFLRGAATLHAEQRELRLKNAADRRRYARLDGADAVDMLAARKKEASAKAVGGVKDRASADKNAVAHVTGGAGKGVANVVEEDDADDVMNELSSSERQQLELENSRLYDEMEVMMTQVREAESKMMEISRLHQIFTHNVVSQAESIERVHDTVVASTENVRLGNEELSKAMRNSVDFRVWVLLFLVTCSFALLFLDWYS